MTHQQNPEDWTRTALATELAEIADEVEGLSFAMLHIERREWSLFRAAATMLADDEQRIHALNEALLRAKGQ